MPSIADSINEFPIPTRKPIGGTFTGAQAIDAMINAKRLQATKPAATVQTLANALTLAASEMITGELITWREYHDGTGVGRNTAALLDAGSAEARPPADGGSVFHVGAEGLYLKGLFPDDVGLSKFGMDLSGTIGAEGYEAAIKYAYDNGKAVIIDTDIHGGYTTATHAYHVVVKGSGKITGLTIEVDMIEDQDDVRSDFEGFQFASLVSRSDTIRFVKGRNVSLSRVKFIDLEKPISGVADENTPFHSIGLIEVANCKFIACDHELELSATHPQNRPYNDIQWRDNQNWFCKQYGIKADQLDGLTYDANLSHFDKGLTTSKNHLCIAYGEQIVIGAGNTCFNSGEDSYLFINTTFIEIGGSNYLRYGGQQVPSSGIKVVNDAAHYLTMTVGGGVHIEKPTLHLIDIQAPNGVANISGVNGSIDYRVAYDAETNPGGHFYDDGVNLGALAHYGINAPLGCEINADVKNLKYINSGGTLLNIPNNYPLPETQMYHGARAMDGKASGSRTITTNASVTLCRIFDSLQTNGDGSGELLVNVYSSTGKRATYKLLVCADTNTAASITQLAAIGSTSGAAADDPAFTFGIYAGGDIYVNRIGSTVSGTFDFVVQGQGDVYPRFLS